MDRARLDFERLFLLHDIGALLVARGRSNSNLRQIYSAPSDRTHGIVCDQTMALSEFYSHKHYPDHPRRVRFKEPETRKTLILPTRLSGPPVTTIGELYKAAWQARLFFK